MFIDHEFTLITIEQSSILVAIGLILDLLKIHTADIHPVTIANVLRQSVKVFLLHLIGL